MWRTGNICSAQKARLNDSTSLALAFLLAFTVSFYSHSQIVSPTTNRPQYSALPKQGQPQEFSKYAGSMSCRQCHPSEYGSWAASHHALAERPIDPTKDQRAFNPPRSLKHASQTSKVQADGGKYEIVTLGFHTNVAPYLVERVIGVEPVRQVLTATSGGGWQVHELSTL